MALKKRLRHRFLYCEYCEISKNTFSYRTPPVAVSDRGFSHLHRRKSKHCFQNKIVPFPDYGFRPEITCYCFYHESTF